MKLSDFIKINSTSKLIALAGLVSTGFLGMALVAQHGFNLHPCELCVAQRVPYALIVAVAITAQWLKPSERTLQKLAFLCVALFAADAAIATYHTGVELGFITGPSACTNSDRPGATIEEMRAAIMNAQLVPCDQPMAYFLGISMAGWNFFAAILASVFTFIILKKIRRHALA